MSIRTVNVWHRLNASNLDGRAVVPLDVVDAQRNVPPQILSAVDELLENISPQHAMMEAYEVEQDFSGIGLRTLLLNARRLQPAADARARLGLAIQDRTAPPSGAARGRPAAVAGRA